MRIQGSPVAVLVAALTILAVIGSCEESEPKRALLPLPAGDRALADGFVEVRSQTGATAVASSRSFPAGHWSCCNWRRGERTCRRGRLSMRRELAARTAARSAAG